MEFATQLPDTQEPLDAEELTMESSDTQVPLWILEYACKKAYYPVVQTVLKHLVSVENMSDRLKILVRITALLGMVNSQQTSTSFQAALSIFESIVPPDHSRKPGSPFDLLKNELRIQSVFHALETDADRCQAVLQSLYADVEHDDTYELLNNFVKNLDNEEIVYKFAQDHRFEQFQEDFNNYVGGIHELLGTSFLDVVEGDMDHGLYEPSMQFDEERDMAQVKVEQKRRQKVIEDDRQKLIQEERKKKAAVKEEEKGEEKKKKIEEEKKRVEEEKKKLEKEKKKVEDEKKKLEKEKKRVEEEEKKKKKKKRVEEEKKMVEELPSQQDSFQTPQPAKKTQKRGRPKKVEKIEEEISPTPPTPPKKAAPSTPIQSQPIVSQLTGDEFGFAKHVLEEKDCFSTAYGKVTKMLEAESARVTVELRGATKKLRSRVKDPLDDAVAATGGPSKKVLSLDAPLATPVKWESDDDMGTEEAQVRKKPKSARAITPLPPLKKAVSKGRPAAGKGRRKRQVWTEDEITMLMEGVQKYGAGKWADIHREYFVKSQRTEIDLKDKWRNCERADPETFAKIDNRKRRR